KPRPSVWPDRESSEAKQLLVSSTNDYPGYLGPNRSGIVKNPRLARDWKLGPPQLLWREPVGAAWSGFAIGGQIAVTLEQRGETVGAYDVVSGTALWTHGAPGHYQTTIAGEGPRTTPTLAANRVYTMGAFGRLNCLDLTTGRLIWAKDVPKENRGEVGEWGVS